jgi:tRNA (guanine37-N1)-methyltransferase
MKLEILSIFPSIFAGFIKESLIGKAISSGALQVTLTNFRDFALPPHRSVDDSPYGGGPGMVLKPEPLSEAVKAAKSRLPAAKVVLLSASGMQFKQNMAHSLSKESEIIFVCGRYEGVDQRFIDKYIDQEISIGDYVLMGGEVPAMVLIESITRLIPGIIGNEVSTVSESYENNLLEAPQYTRPTIFEGAKVPDTLLSGDHKAIEKWRNESAVQLTSKRRPDLLNKIKE